MIAPPPAIPNRPRIDLRLITGAALAVLLLRVAFGLLALPISAAFPDTELEQQVGLAPSAPIDQWLLRVAVAPWQRYDAWNYTRIASHGYRIGDGTAAFHPLYPLLAAPLGFLLGNITLALLIVSSLTSIALAVVFTRYVELFHTAALAQTATWLLLLMPPAFIMLAPYNESLFLVLAVGTFWALREKRWWLAGFLGGLGALTRQQGIALALPLAWEVWIGWRQGRARWWHAAAVAMVPAAYGLFIVYRALALGDLATIGATSSLATFLRTFLVSGTSERVVVGQRIDWPWVAVIDQTRLVFTTEQSYNLAIDLGLGLAGIALIGIYWRRMHPAEALYSIGIVILSLCYYNGESAPLLSLPRHILLAFPLFIVLARLVGTGRLRRHTLQALFLANFFLAGAFFRHGWVP